MKSVVWLTVEKGFGPSQQGRHGNRNSGQIVTLIYSQNPERRQDSTHQAHPCDSNKAPPPQGSVAFPNSTTSWKPSSPMWESIRDISLSATVEVMAMGPERTHRIISTQVRQLPTRQPLCARSLMPTADPRRRQTRPLPAFWKVGV